MMYFGGLGQFNFGCFTGGFNNMFFPQMFNFAPFFPMQMPLFNYTQPANFWGNSNFDTFEKTTSPLANYNAAKGKLLTNIALNRAPGETGYCAKYVQEAINLAGLGGVAFANADEMANVLRNNPNFQEISRQTDVKTLPAGCVLVYDKQVRKPDELYGHCEFTTEDHKGISDGITESLHPNPSAIFIPV